LEGARQGLTLLLCISIRDGESSSLENLIVELFSIF